MTIVIFEIHRPALPIGQAAVVQDLQHDVEDVVVSFFDFVEQDHRVRAPAHGFSELPAFFVADVARRRADQPRDRVLLLVFGHVDADHGVFVVEQEVGEGAGELGFTDTRRT